MKKNLIASFVVLLFTGSLLAANPYLYGVSRSSSCTVSQTDGAVTESYLGIDGGRYETTATLSGSDVNFTFVARGASSYSFTSNPNFITVYKGNYDLDNWSPVDFSIDSMPSAVTTPQTQNKDDDTLVQAAEVCIVAATVCLCSIALWDMCDSYDNTYYYPDHRHHHDGPTVFIDPFIDTPSSSSRSYSSNNYLYNYNSGSDYMIGFHIKASGGPDYRVRVNTGTEVFDYYFLRSDRKTSNNLFLKAKENPYNGLVLTFDAIDLERFGFNYIYSGQPVGLYLGLNLSLSVCDGNYYSSKLAGSTFDHDYTNIVPSNPGESIVGFTGNMLDTRNVIGFTCGMDFKLVDHLWLMGGVGVDFRDDYVYGTAELSDGTTKSNVCIKDTYITLYPQVGLNLILGNFDLGAMYSYIPDDQGSRIDIMCGFAF